MNESERIKPVWPSDLGQSRKPSLDNAGVDHGRNGGGICAAVAAACRACAGEVSHVDPLDAIGAPAGVRHVRPPRRLAVPACDLHAVLRHEQPPKVRFDRVVQRAELA